MSGRAQFVLVVSGRRLIAEATQNLYRAQPGVEECLAVSASAQLPDPARTGRQLTMVIDLDDPGLDRPHLAEALAVNPAARKVGFCDIFTSPNAQLAFHLGLTQVVTLTSPLAHLVALVSADRPDSSATAAVGLKAHEVARLNSLTARELEVLNHIARGRPVKDVAIAMGITVHTVETHKRRCFAKLGVSKQAHAVALAVSAGMLPSA